VIATAILLLLRSAMLASPDCANCCADKKYKRPHENLTIQRIGCVRTVGKGAGHE